MKLTLTKLMCIGVLYYCFISTITYGQNDRYAPKQLLVDRTTTTIPNDSIPSSQQVQHIGSLNSTLNNISLTWDQNPGDLDLNFSCSEDVNILATPTASGTLCTISIIQTSDETTSINCNNQFTRVLTYVASDDCNNQSVPYTITITVDDVIPPIWNEAHGSLDITFTCEADLSIPQFPIPTDNCGGNTITISLTDDVTMPGQCPNQFIRTITYIANDGCGNQSVPYTVTLTVSDNEAPTWITPIGSLDNTFNCSADLVIPPPPVSTDNCSDNNITVSVVSDEIVNGACSNQYVRIITYQAEDGCGNLSVPFFVTLTVDDSIPPEISCPIDVTIECGGDTTPSNTGYATAINNCGAFASLSLADTTIPGVCSQEFVIVRTWTGIDPCGNLSTCEQHITVTSPEVMVSCPNTIEYSAADFPSQATLEVSYANWLSQFIVINDGCNAAYPDLSQYNPPSFNGPTDVTQIINIAFTATDDCSSATCSASFTFYNNCGSFGDYDQDRICNNQDPDDDNDGIPDPFDPLNPHCLDTCNLVWPGDFNNDGIVDNEDILYWSLAEGNTGPPRPNTTIYWVGQCASDWPTIIRGVNAKHMDGNGDGIINTPDLQIFGLNYGSTHPIISPDNCNDLNNGEISSFDLDPMNRYICQDADQDGCEDCLNGTSDPNNDGPDNDNDGICDSGDTDDDNDGVPDVQDAAPFDAGSW